MSTTLTPAEIGPLRDIAGAMIPANADLRMPAADDPLILENIVRSVARDLPLVREAIGAITKKANGAFARLDQGSKESLLNNYAANGGAAICIPQKKGYWFQPGGILSPDGHCRPFDASGQGTVVGNGVGMVVLKRLSDAVEDGDAVLAVIKGFGLNNDGSSKVGYTAPSIEGQAQAIGTEGRR